MRSSRAHLVAAIVAGLAGVLAAVALADPTPVTSSQRVNETIARDQFGGGVGMAADGRFAVAYAQSTDTYNDVYVRLYDAAGAPASASLPINPTADEEGDPQLGMAANGDMVVVYRATVGNDDEVRAQRISAAGALVGSEIAVNTTVAGDKHGARVAMAPDGHFVVTWVDFDHVDARVFDADGSPATGEVDVADNFAGQPAVAINSAGKFVVVFLRSTTIGQPGTVQARRFTAAGAADGVEFPALTGGTNQNFSRPVVGLAGDGRMIVVISGSIGGAQGVYGQRLGPGPANTLATAGPEKLDDPASNGADHQEVAMQDDGAFAVSWWTQVGTEDWVYLSQFSALAARQGAQFDVAHVSLATPSPFMAISGAGAAAVAWTGFDGGGGNNSGAFTRLMSFVGTPPVTTTTTTATTTTTTTTTTQAPVTTTQAPATTTATQTAAATTAATTPAPAGASAVLGFTSFGSAVTLPAAKTCVSRRSFRIRVHKQAGVTIVKAEVSVNGKRVQTLTGKRITATVDLRKLPKGRFTVKIKATASDGKVLVGSRRYRTCAKKRAGGKVKL